MAVKEMLATQFAYNEWANERIFAVAEGATDLDWSRGAVEGQRSLRELLFHTFMTEFLWRSLVETRRVPEPLPRIEEIPTLAAMHRFALEEAGRMKELLERLTEEDILATAQVVDGDGSVVPIKVWHMLQQLLNHSLQHRSEAGLVLAGMGHSPGDLDFIFFV